MQAAIFLPTALGFVLNYLSGWVSVVLNVILGDSYLQEDSILVYNIMSMLLYNVM